MSAYLYLGPRKKRSKPRPGRLQGDDMDELRQDAFDRDNGQCIECRQFVIFDAPTEQDNSMHLAHRRGKRMWGDHINQVDTQCGRCHRLEHAYGKSRIKPCPPKNASNAAGGSTL